MKQLYQKPVSELLEFEADAKMLTTSGKNDLNSDDDYNYPFGK